MTSVCTSRWMDELHRIALVVAGAELVNNTQALLFVKAHWRVALSLFLLRHFISHAGSCFGLHPAKCCMTAKQLIIQCR